MACMSVCTVCVKGKTLLGDGFLRDLGPNGAENVQHLKKKNVKTPATWQGGVQRGAGRGFWTHGAGLVKNATSRPSSSFRGRPQPPLCKPFSPEALHAPPGLKQLLSPRLTSSSGLRLTFSSIESGFGSNHGASE